MAYYTARINLAAASFPMLTELWGQSIIVPQYDQNFDRQVVSAADQDRDKGIPQAYYMHNVTPTTNGYQSVAYDAYIPTYFPPDSGTPASDFDKAFPIQVANTSKFIFVPSAGKNYIYSSVAGVWQSVSPLAVGTVPDNVVVTTAYLHGETYIYYANYGCFVFDPTTFTMVPTTLTALTPADILGVVAANGYMLAWTETGVAWSSLTDPTDFTPSLTTGAGGGSVNDAKGPIKVCLPISGGFIVYCERNAVAAKFTGNTRYPFVFAEIPGSLGIRTPEQVTWQSNLSSHFAWTLGGLQELDKNGVKTTFAEPSDFISAKVFEDFDEQYMLFVRFPLTVPMTVKLTIIASRYLIMSYGREEGIYTHALFYDVLLKRWGKLKITHRSCFEWNFPSLVGALTYFELLGSSYQQLTGTSYTGLNGVVNTIPNIKQSIAFLQQDGVVQIVNFEFDETFSSGILVTGKYQFMRSNWTIHLSTNIETVLSYNAFHFYIIPFYDGKTPGDKQTPMNINFGPEIRSYSKRITCLSYAMLFQGAFNLNSIETTFTKGGTR